VKNLSQRFPVQYSEIYPGIDLVFYGNQRQLEFDFIVSPGKDPDKISLRFTGAESIHKNEAGDLEVVLTDKEKIFLRKPIIYQEIEGARKIIEGEFNLKETNEVGFTLAAYDSTKPLIIDPVLSYSSFLGGNFGAGFVEEALAVAVDSSNNAYIAGRTDSPDFPTLDAAQSVYGGGSRDAFVTKLDALGALVYSTYLGGSASGEEKASGIAADSAGNVFVDGFCACKAKGDFIRILARAYNKIKFQLPLISIKNKINTRVNF